MRRIFSLFFFISISLVSTVLAQTSDPGACDINRAIFNNDLDRIEKLLDAGCDVNGKCGGETPLLAVCKLMGSPVGDEQKAKVIRILLERGANPNTQDNLGETPLIKVLKISSADNLSVSVIELLLDRGADPNVKDRTGKSAIQAGLTHNNRQVSDVFAAYLKRQKQAQREVQPAAGDVQQK